MHPSQNKTIILASSSSIFTRYHLPV